MTYPKFPELLKLVIDNGYKFGISTKGIFMTEQIIDILSSGPHEDCFVNFSIDAANSRVYNSLRGVKANDDHFKRVHDKISALKTACDKRGCKLRVKASYLIFSENSNEEYFDLFVSLYKDLVSEIRFSIPQVPNVAQPIGYLDTLKAKEIRRAIHAKYLDEEKIVVLEFDQSEHDRSFDKCWAQRFNLTVDRAGYVYPCPQVATKNYSNLIFGNITEQSILDIWNSEERKILFNADVDCEMKCRVCDRKDEAINIELNKLLGR
jgi:radical SAM protein with 4Fe4S-binding SPASM domain